MNNTRVKNYLIHSAGPKIDDWGKVGTETFKQAKHDYNVGYYQRNKEKWKPIDEQLQDKANEIEEQLHGRVNETLDNLSTQAINSATAMAANYLDSHKEEIAKRTVDSLETIGKSAISVGKEILNEMKRRAQDSWNVGVDTIISKAKKAKNNFESAFNSGMDSIVSGVKSFASLWKSGW